MRSLRFGTSQILVRAHGFERLVIGGLVSAGHDRWDEAGCHVLTACFRVEVATTPYGGSQVVGIVDDYAGMAIDDHFSDGAAAERHDRSATRHRLYHDHAEWLFPANREYQASSSGQEVPFGCRIGNPEEPGISAKPRRNLLGEVRPLDRLGALARQHDGQPGSSGRVDSQMRGLIRMEPT